LADLALCLAVDGSASVDFGEFGLMMGGLAAALRDPDVGEALAAGPRGAALVALLLWSGPAAREVLIPWTRIASRADAAGFADAIEQAPRIVPAGGTAIGEALAAGFALLANAPGAPARLVLDLSGDGPSNAGRAPGPIRDLGVAAGVTINGLAVLNEAPDLVANYAEHVIGGPGAFVMDCADYADFAEAMRRKLLREARGAPVA
jgi:hypothetical protein